MADKPISVLLIEDNPTDALAIKIMLESAELPFALETANKLTTGMEILTEKDIDIILLDLGLPDTKGLKTFDKLQVGSPDVPIVIYTGLEDEELAIKALKKGAQDYLVKGKIDSGLLMRALRYAIERHRLRIELKRKTDELRESEMRFRTLLEKSSDGILILDSDRIIQYVNPVAEDIFRKKAEELKNEIFDFPLEPGRTKTIDINQLEGETAKVEMHVVETELGGLTFYIVSLRDITELVEREQEEKKLREMTLRDELTGLYNRRGFYTLAKQLIEGSNRNKDNMILFFIDVDNLKNINDTYSHQKGDQALIDAANIIKQTFRESDIIARFGGDEFVIFAKEVRKSLGEKLSVRFNRNLNSHNKNNERPYKLSLSMGIARCGKETPCSIYDLINKADKSMYDQKHINRGL